MAPHRGDLYFELTRVLPAPAPVVFPIFSESAEMERWWGRAGFSIPSIRFDARVGERYRIEMQPPEGKTFFLTGEFREVDPPCRLAYTFIWEAPDPDDVETVVELSFVKLGDSTEVTLVQGGFQTEARLALHQGGWIDGFGKIERLLSE